MAVPSQALNHSSSIKALSSSAIEPFSHKGLTWQGATLNMCSMCTCGWPRPSEHDATCCGPVPYSTAVSQSYVDLYLSLVGHPPRMACQFSKPLHTPGWGVSGVSHCRRPCATRSLLAVRVVEMRLKILDVALFRGASIRVVSAVVHLHLVLLNMERGLMGSQVCRYSRSVD